MKTGKNAKRTRLRRVLIPLLVLLLLLAAAGAAFGVYVSNYYHADSEALALMESPYEGVSLEERSDGSWVVSPAEGEPTAGLIFYPGGKVEHTAYLPLLENIAREGILCVLVKMPCNLAVLDPDAAKGIPEQFPEIHRWYLGGHSLGGAMAASYLAKHSGDYEGLLLLAAYSTADLSDSGLSVLSVYGSEDGVLSRDTYEKYRGNLPEDFTEVILPGGNHAGFGCYGEQSGDNSSGWDSSLTTPMTQEEQWHQTALAFRELIDSSL